MIGSQYELIPSHMDPFQTKFHDFHKFNSSNTLQMAGIWDRFTIDSRQVHDRFAIDSRQMHDNQVHDRFMIDSRQIHERFTIDSRQIWDRYTIIKLTNMGEKYFQESDLRIWVKNQEFGPGSGSIKLFLLGLPPPDPLLFLGAPPLKLSVFLGYTMGSWIHDRFLDSRVPGFTMSP